MSNERTQTAEEQRTKTRAEQSTAPLHATGAANRQSVDISQLSMLIANPSIEGRGNSSTKADALLAMQKTHGNRAVQRFVHNSSPPSGRTLPVQRILGLDYITDAASDAYDWTKKKAGNAAESVLDAGSKAWDWTADKAEGAWDWTKGAAKSGYDTVGDAYNWTADKASSAWDWTKGAAKSVGGGIADAWDWTTDKVGGAWDWLTKDKPKTFDDLAAGDVTGKNAPDKITLPKEMQDGMTKAWEGSLPGGKSQEQGGILVKDADGSYKWKAGKSLPLDKGGSGSFSVNRDDVGKGETLVASGHTHPYDESEGGHTDVSFSGTDLANLIYNPENMKMVKSGEGEFVAAKTKEFTDKVNDLDDKGKKKMYSEMKSKYDDTFKNTKGTFEEKNAAAAKAVSDEYGLAYYEGSGGELTRQ